MQGLAPWFIHLCIYSTNIEHLLSARLCSFSGQSGKRAELGSEGARLAGHARRGALHGGKTGHGPGALGSDKPWIESSLSVSLFKSLKFIYKICILIIVSITNNIGNHSRIFALKSSDLLLQGPKLRFGKQMLKKNYFSRREEGPDSLINS